MTESTDKDVRVGQVRTEQLRAERLLGVQAKAADPVKLHLVDAGRQIGGFYEELLDLGHAGQGPAGAGTG
jgi:hypothetical protein